jgi:hypothetical protein
LGLSPGLDTPPPHGNLAPVAAELSCDRRWPFAVTDDNAPSVNAISSSQSVFGQAIASGTAAELFTEGKPGNCARENGGSSYAVKHNPWACFTAERGLCRRFDAPIENLNRTVSNGTLPKVGKPGTSPLGDARR